MNEIIEKIRNYEYISFDIFDTLIKRNLPEPKSLFRLVELKYNEKFNAKIKEWESIRVDAERLARQKCKKEEITLEEIYNNIQYKDIDIAEMKKLEIETELELCVRNKRIEKIYQYCIEKKKKIIIISDMYLDENIVKEILKINKIQYDYIYVSSKYRITKNSGNLFKYVLKEQKIKKEQIIHIGDNIKSDYEIPKKLGINAIKISEDNYLSYCNKKDVLKEDKFKYRCLNSFINNNIDVNQNYYWKFGYENLGPLLYGYVKWLEENFEKQNYDNIYFLSRDGYIMQKAFEKINKDIKSKYIYASRRALTVPTICLYDNLQEILENMLIPKEITVRAFLKKMGLIPEKYEKVLEKYNLNLNSIMLLKNINKDGIIFYNDIKKDIIKNSEQENKNLERYYRANDFKGKVAIVDIGWYGNMQLALEKVMKANKNDVDITGYYIGIVPNSEKQDKLKMNGYLFDRSRPELYLKKKFFNAIFELIFLAPHGSAKRYTENSKDVELYEYEYNNTDTYSKIQNIQKGAIQFIEEYKKSNISKYKLINERVVSYSIIEFGNRPRKLDINNFGNIIFYDDDYRKINNAKSGIHYIFHPKEFRRDFELSIWKTAFLKTIFKSSKIPYYEILEKIRERLKK